MMADNPTPTSLARQVQALQSRFETHQAVCEQRQGTIIARLGRIEALAIGATGSLIVGLLWLVFVRHGL